MLFKSKKYCNLIRVVYYSLLFISCSPGFQDKIIKGKNITESFFLLHQGKYKNGLNKHIVIYKNPITRENRFELNMYIGVQGLVKKENNHFKIIPSNIAPLSNITSSTNDTPNRFQIECRKKYDFRVLRVEEIPSKAEDEKSSQSIKLAKKNPLPLKYFIYPISTPTKTSELSQIYEPNENLFNQEELIELKATLSDFCTKKINEQNDDLDPFNQSSSYGPEKYFAMTDITENGFSMIDDNAIHSNSKQYYQPLYSYQSVTRYTIIKDIEFSKEDSNETYLPLSKINYVQSIDSQDDSLKGARRGYSLRGITTEIKFQYTDKTLFLNLNSSDPNCRINYLLMIPIQGIYLINNETKRSKIISNSGEIKDFQSYINSDIDITSVITQFSITDSGKRHSLNEPVVCPVIDKLKLIKDQNQTINLAFSYVSHGSTLSIVLLDSFLNIIDHFDSLERIQK